ncbi:MAG: GNAT family N-acetyltransferase [Gaiellales bacterium]
MKTDSELVVVANDNFVASFRKVVEHSPEGEVRWFDRVFAFVTGLPLSLFNGCVVVGPADAPQLDAALSWLSGSKLPHQAFIAADVVAGLSDIPLDHGLRRDPDPYPGMVLHPIPGLPAPAAGVTVVRVTELGLDEHLQVCTEVGLPRPVAQRLYSPSLVADPDVQLFVARLDGRPVGKSLAIRSPAASGVYDVGTLKTARRRGVGSAVTWAAIAAGQAWGCDAIVLQSSQMGLSMYGAMGFRTVVSYTTFSKPMPERANE